MPLNLTLISYRVELNHKRTLRPSACVFKLLCTNVRVEFRWARRHLVLLKPTVLFLKKTPDGFRLMDRMAIDNKKDRRRRIDYKALQELGERRSRSRPSVSMKRNWPWAPMAEIMLTPKRARVLDATGAWPRRPQLVPLWKSERTPASSPQNICAPRRCARRRNFG